MVGEGGAAPRLVDDPLGGGAVREEGAEPRARAELEVARDIVKPTEFKFS